MDDSGGMNQLYAGLRPTLTSVLYACVNVTESDLSSRKVEISLRIDS
jgi:hypothetical protein